MSTPPPSGGAPLIRAATSADVAAITRIYNEGIADRLATLETEERSETERAAWLSSREARHPVFVAVRGAEVAGWASLNPFSPRPAYRFVADISVYVGRADRGAGVGSALLAGLIAAGQQLSYHKLVLAALPCNETGMRLYRRYGFREVGIYREQGQLDGQWVDTVVMELLLDEQKAGGGKDDAR
ncbi:MAG: N-acetyltransferase [Chloroflexia bacterium]|nr:N-acetyltransferase [Chloroflexia bacterium]